MSSYQAFAKLILHSFTCLSIAFSILGSILPDLSYCEQTHAVTAEQVDEILKQIDGAKGEKLQQASAKLYSMGPEIDPLLLQKLREVDITKLENPYGISVTIATVLFSRGYDKDVFDILKSRLRSENPEDRLSGAVMLAKCYHYKAVRDLASIVSGEKDPGYLNERVMYEWKATSAEVVEQILEVMRSKSEIAKRFVISLLRATDMDCPDCQDDAGKWKSFLKKSKNVGYLSSDLLGDHKLSGGEILGPREPAPSADGKKIAFEWGYISGKKYKTDLWIMDTSTNKITKLQIPGITSVQPAWSPSGDRLLFMNISSKGFNICTIKEDGSEFCVWTKSFLSMNQFKAVWSYDSTKIAFVKIWTLPFAFEIWVTDLNKNNNMRVVKDNFCELLNTHRWHPTWFLSKDDRILLWDCYGDDKTSVGLYSISVSAPEKEEFVQAFDLDKSVCNLAPSPDETKLAYIKDDSTLFIYDSTTKETREYAIGEGDLGDSTWTPDGKSIIFQRYNNRKSEIRILSLETGKSTKLTNGSFWGQAFAPGGNALYYLKRDRLRKQASIWRINLDGTNNTKIFPVRGTEYTSVQPTPILKWAERN